MSSGSSSTKSNPTLTLISILPSSILIVVVESLIFFNFISLSCLASYSSQTNGERSQLCVLEALRFSLVPSSIPSSSPLFFNRIQNLPQKLCRFVFIFLQWEPGVSHSKIQYFQLEMFAPVFKFFVELFVLAGLWLLVVAMRLAMRQGLSSNTEWPMDALRSYPKR